MCMFEPNFKPYGPFPTAEWAVFVQPEYFARVVPWFMQRRHVKGRIDKAGAIGSSLSRFHQLFLILVPSLLSLDSSSQADPE